MSNQNLLNAFKNAESSINSHVIGQQAVTQQLLIALLANGHVLLQGLPGLAKTRAANALAKTIDTQLKRVQFTPDMLPSDIIGSEIFNSHSQEFYFQKGPIFTHLLLADEINRAPAKVQSALLEAMAEEQVSSGGKTHQLHQLFMVLATQNPVDQEGTYPLPEAQMDRFLIQVLIDYPEKESEIMMLKMLREQMNNKTNISIQLSIDDVISARAQVNQVFVSDAIDQYIVDLVDATRNPGFYDEELAQWIELGVSPRATIALDKCGRAYAWLQGRDYVTADDIRAIVLPVFRHRLTLSFLAMSQQKNVDVVINKIITTVAWV